MDFSTDHFSLFNLPRRFKVVAAELDTRYREIQSQVHPDRFANAGDAGGQRYSSKLLKGVAPGAATQRITELPKWVSEHRKVPDWEWRHKEVRTKANCVACHTAAEQGYYEE